MYEAQKIRVTSLEMKKHFSRMFSTITLKYNRVVVYDRVTSFVEKIPYRLFSTLLFLWRKIFINRDENSGVICGFN